MYKYLFSPININKCAIKNRIAYPALGLLYSYDTRLNDRYYNFYAERAAGGAGIVTVGPVGVDYIGSGVMPLSLARDEAIPDFAKLARRIADSGARSWVQLFHAGRYTHPILINMETPIAPSPVYSTYSKTTPREMTMDDIRAVQKAFVEGARRAQKAGIDGVEILGSGGYLITQFLSPLTNKRTDQYGGSFENRTRFPREVLTMIREAVGPDYPVTIRMAGNDFMPESNTDEDTPAFAEVYEAAGADAINVTGGWHETRVPQLPMELPRAAFSFLALNVKKRVRVPVMASNRIADPGRAEEIIRQGCADMVNLGRVLIADPYWPQKAREGRADEIRPCVACSQGCTDMVFSGKPVYCVGNPRAGYEAERPLVKTGSPKKVMVVGAGPAGMEAAVTAAQRGHQVDLYEASGDIGGQLWLAGAPPHKQEIREFVRYYRTMIARSGVRLHLNTRVDAGFIKQQNPGHLVVAEGAEPLVPPIPGVDDPCVVSAWDVLCNNPLLGKNLAVIGGGSVGLETAMFLAAKGTIGPEVLHFLFTYDAIPPARLKELLFTGTHRVTVFEMLDKAGKDVGKSTRWVLFDNLKRHNIRILTGARVTSIEDGTLCWEREGQKHAAQFDNVILASGAKPRATLSEAVKDQGIPVSRIGDCTGIARIGEAIHGGFLAAAMI
ncbi:MAG: NAD(P)/FAD-dependent oxidoreductase [Thermodesulfobacteriota bacterium]